MPSAKTVEQLPCKLSAEETLLKSKQLVQLSIDHKELEDAKKLATAGFKEKLDEKKDQMSKLIGEIHRGEEMRPIECVEVPRYESMMVDVMRTDLGTIFRQRPMHPSERQAAFDLGDVRPVTSIGSAKKRKAAPEPQQPDNDNDDENPSDKH